MGGGSGERSLPKTEDRESDGERQRKTEEESPRLKTISTARQTKTDQVVT